MAPLIALRGRPAAAARVADRLVRPVAGAGLLIATTLALLALAPRAGGDAAVTDNASQRAIAAHPAGGGSSVSLRFVDLADGAVQVIDGQHVRPLAVLQPGAESFLRGALRALTFERRKRGIGPEAPFELVDRGEAGLYLVDPQTATHISLNAFGSTNAAAFARLYSLAHPEVDATRREETR